MFLLPSSVLACFCGKQYVSEKFIQSDFVAKIKVLKKYNNIGDSNYYRIDVTIENLYKGSKVNSLFVYGNYGTNRMTSCDVNGIEENNSYIIYSNMNDKGEYTLEACSQPRNLDSDLSLIQKKLFEDEIKILKKLKRKKIKYSIKSLVFPSDIDENLKIIDRIKCRKKYAVYEVIFDSDLKVKKINIISKFKNSIDKKIIKVLKSTKWQPNFIDDSKITEGFKQLVIINNKNELNSEDKYLRYY